MSPLRFAVLVLFALTSFALTAPEKWAPAIAALTSDDETNPPAPHGIVFVGSSSIARWKTLAQDFPGLPVINRGFGGSKIGDGVFYADRIVIPYAPRIVVLYSGENDLAAGESPESVYEGFKAFVAKVHVALPESRIIYVSMKPSPSRWALADKFVTGNRLIAAECARDPRLTFLDVWSPMLGPDGKPRPELFVQDQLHLNHDGYLLWVKLIAPRLK